MAPFSLIDSVTTEASLSRPTPGMKDFRRPAGLGVGRGEGRATGGGPAPRPPPRALRGADAAQLSLVAAYDDLARNAAVLNDGSAEKEFAKFVGHVKDWRKR